MRIINKKLKNMSLEVYSQEQIVNHLENNSPTKFMYSFSKAPRFPTLKRCGKSDKFYNLPSMRSTRGTSLGFGTKYDFTRKNGGSEFISIKRYFDKGNQPGVKYTFGLSREKFRKAFCPGFKIIDRDIPGPGKYNVLREPGEDSPHYSIHEKCNSKSFSNKLFNNPGPGEYTPLISINSEGKYPISKISNIKSTHFGNDKSKRFYYKLNNVPGPGSYKIKGLMGVNFNSKYKSVNLISMHKKFKKKDRDNYPGPGSYSSFSEFGILTPRTDSTIYPLKLGNSIKLSPIKKKENDKSMNEN